MRLPLFLLAGLLSAEAAAQTAALPQVRTADGTVVLRAQPTQTVDDAGRRIDPRAPITSGSTSTAVVLAAADTFQQVIAASGNRLGCMVQNKGEAATVRIFLGAVGLATAARSIDIAPGETFSCASAGGLVINDAIAAAATVAGTSIVVVTQ